MSQPLPDEAVNGTAEALLAATHPDVRRVVVLLLLKLLAMQREASINDGAALMALAKMEVSANFWLTSGPPQPKRLFTSEPLPENHGNH